MNHAAYTKQQIFQAFTTLLNRVPFEKITVEMILMESGISKSTFYRHFHDKYDVLNFNSMALADRLIGQSTCKDWNEFLHRMCHAIAEDSRYYRHAFRSSGQNAHSGFLYAYSYSIVENCYLTTNQLEAVSIHDHYAIGHYCHGCVGILQDWLNNPDTMTPDEVADLFYEVMPEYLRHTWLAKKQNQ